MSCHMASSPQAAGHDRVALEVAGEKPEVRVFTSSSASMRDMGPAVCAPSLSMWVMRSKHQHGAGAAPAVGVEQPSLARGDRLFVGKESAMFSRAPERRLGRLKSSFVQTVAPVAGPIIQGKRGHRRVYTLIAGWAPVPA